MKKDFELISHTADLQIRVYGTTIAELFKNALIGMFQAIEPRTDACEHKNDRLVCNQLPISRNIIIESYDQTSLLVDFLSEALYLSDVHNEAYLDANIQNIAEKKLTATIFGIPVTGFAIEIKAVTYHDLRIEKINDSWQADIVFDI